MSEDWGRVFREEHEGKHKVKINCGKAAQSRGPTLWWTLGRTTDHEILSLLSQKWSALMERVWMGYTRHWALLALHSQDPAVFLPFIFVMWLLMDFNLFQHWPHCLSGNNMSSWSRSLIWEKSGIPLPPWRTLGWSLSSSHHTDQLTPLRLQTGIWSSCC